MTELAFRVMQNEIIRSERKEPSERGIYCVRGKFQVAIKVKGKVCRFGSFADIYDARAARYKALAEIGRRIP